MSPVVAPPEHLMTVAELAEYLRIPKPTVYYLNKQGKLPGRLIGGRWRFAKSDIDARYLNSREDQRTALAMLDPLNDADTATMTKFFKLPETEILLAAKAAVSPTQ